MEPREDMYSIITDDYQLLHNLKSNSIKLFNLESDPLAKSNIAKDHDVIVERLLSELKKVYSVMPLHKASTISLDEQTRKQLEALGYIDEPIIAIDDEDFDGIPDGKDNCINLPNPDQEDQDSDSFGDGCDNCLAILNPDQSDSDNDGTGDACEPDNDNDSVVDDDDNCPFASNPDQKDSYPPHGNTIGDACDCEGDFNCDGSVDDMDAKIFKKSKFKNMILANPCTNEDQCNGDFNCNGKIDEEDEMLFKSDLGRHQHHNPCPPCVVGKWCVYE